MRDALVALALLVSLNVAAVSCVTTRDHQVDVAVLTHKKVTVWPNLYAERDADGLADFLADGFKVLEPDGTIRTREDEIAWLRATPPDEEQSDFVFTIEEIVLPPTRLRSSMVAATQHGRQRTASPVTTATGRRIRSSCRTASGSRSFHMFLA